MVTELFPMLDPDYIDNPAPYWQQLREGAPLYWSKDFNCWLITKYEDVETFVKRPEGFFSSSGPGGGFRAEDGSTAEESVGFLPMIQNDPPEQPNKRTGGSSATF